MKQNDGRIIWKNQSDLKLILTINEFIEKHGIKSSRQYQKKLAENPNSAPSMWFINKKYGSWENLLISIGKENTDYGKWSRMSEQELLEIVESFIKCEKISSQRMYEKKSVEKDIPSLSTVKKRLGDIRPLFKVKNEKPSFTDFELLLELKNEIIRLDLQDDLSMIKFRKLVQSPKLPSVDTIMKRTNKNWEELMTEIGFDYRRIKIYKQRNNLSKTKKTK
ncbi:hypothetical protein DVX38_08975 [Enterococcus faecium]|uniref:hypothetical protein n=1 Tax=Enterococcus faecium TaxID=1352 RepID=UPI00100F3991|nr:hypothetical protein [Enterococcus faecium]MDK2779896.1 hypothetical protein [Trichococcus sp.]MBW4152341.1 hypothetical protein [Enterococcus faecium]RXW37541.1 hypothetical protein CYQ87_08890 [Enterococcus faecium]RXW61095.1 hypothetical protein CYQ72_09335 [Enterococcus faecium]RXW88209.1 hypothetical protein CYQ63_09370 [Enterococcus faecium]